MARKNNVWWRIISMLLSLALIVSLMPSGGIFTATAVDSLSTLTADNSLGITGTVADESTMNSWKDAFDPVNISTEHAGGVWTDKSVFTAGGAASAFTGISGVEVGGENFLVALSAMGANSVMAGQGSVPTDTVFVLDISGSMSNSELRAMVNATNDAMHTLLSGEDNENRVGVVLYSSNAHELLPLDHYTPVVDDGTTEYIELSNGWGGTQIRSARVREGWETQYLKDSDGNDVDVSVQTTGGTYIQGGLWTAWKVFEAASVTDTRTPIVVLMSDGAPTYTTQNFNNVPDDPNYGAGNSSTPDDGFVTQLTAAWVKEKVAAKYNTQAFFYTLGLGVDNVTNSEVAKAVLNPSGSPNEDITDAWDSYDAMTTGGTQEVTLGDSGGDSPSVTYDSTVDGKRAYVDRYFPAAQASDLSAAFQNIVNEISLKSGYYVTRLDGENANLGGYITFVDEIGTGMEVKEIEGILIGTTLYSGALLASSLENGAFGTLEEPTALGDNMVWALQSRLGIDTATARSLLAQAYAAGQVSYDETTGEFSNYIGWFGDADGKYLGFWDAENPNAVIPEGAAFATKCYGMLGSTTDAQTNHASDMMYISIQVTKSVTADDSGNAVVAANSPETVTFRIPASLLPMVTYQIQLDGEDLDSSENATVTYLGAEPIRLLYEVGIHSQLTQLNIEEFLRPGYQAKDENGNYYLYTNAWWWEGADDVDWRDESTHPSKEDATGNGVLMDTGRNKISYAYFEPGEDNEHYYFTEDVQIYVKNGDTYTPITQVPASATGTTYYYQHVIFSTTQSGVEDAGVITRSFEELSEAAVQAAIDNNSVYVPKGTMHYHNHSHDRDKTVNATGSYFAVRHQLVDAKINSSNQEEHGYELVYLGNNGRITYAPTQGLLLAKSMNDGSTPDVSFTFDITLSGTELAASYRTIHVDASGKETEGTADVTNGVITVSLKPGEQLYILDLPAGTAYTVTERRIDGYLQSSSTGASGTVPAGELAQIGFVNQVRGTGSLTVVKSVIYEKGAEKTDAAANHTFPVTVTFMDGDQPFNGTVLVDGKETAVTNGTLSFTITDGQSVVITNVPEGVTYTVAEGTALPEGYSFSADDSTDLKGTITQTGELELIANTYTPDDVTIDDVTPPTVSIEVSKTLVTEQSGVDFTFHFKLQEYDAESQTWKDVYVNGQLVTTDITLTAAGTGKADLDLRGLTFTSAGVYDFRVVEIIPETTDAAYISGMTYDRTFHDFEIVVGDPDLDGQLEIVEVRAVQHAQVTEGEDAFNVTTGFTNTYAVGSTKLTFQGNKVLTDLTGGANTQMALQDGQFSFELFETDETFQIPDDAEAVTALNGVQGPVIFPTLTYTEAGTYYYVIREVQEDAKGYTYDGDVYKITVTVSEVTEGTERNLEVTKVTVAVNDGEAEDVTANVKDNVLNGTTIVFENTYEAESTDAVVLGGKKTLSGWNVADKTFRFTLKDADGNTVETVVNSGESFTFTGLTFDKAGTYVYTITEVMDDQDGITYDGSVYTVTITVTDDGTGKLKASAVYAKDGVPLTSPDFANSYDAEDSAPVVLGGTKTLTGRDLANGEFYFVLKDAEGNVLQTVKNVGATFSFEGLVYTEPGTYQYTVSEVKGTLGGVTYDETVYDVTVTVTDNGSGKLQTAVSYASGGKTVEKLGFVNSYAHANAKVQLTGLKTLVGGILTDGQFTFQLKQGEDVIDTATNDAQGNIVFDELTFTQEGTYVYTVVEVKGEASGYTYDETVYTVTITVTDNGQGQLVAAVDVPGKGDIDQDFQFFNRYSPETSDGVILSGEKTLTGRDMTDGEFSFVLKDDQGNVVQTVTNKDGKFTFDGLIFDKAGTYVYTVSEVKGEAAGVTYDETIYTVTITVTDENGKLKTTVSYTKGEQAVEKLVFANSYTVEETDEVVLGGKKTLSGWNVADKTFRFTLKDANGNIVETVVNSGESFTFTGLTFDKAGTYVYTITEVADGQNGITYDGSVYTVTITVTDENAKLKATVVYTKNGEPVTSPDFTNSYDAEDSEPVVLGGTKTLTGRDMADGEFSFVLKDAEGNVLQTVKNEDGTFTFEGIAYTEPGTYVYTVSEVKGEAGGVTYDETVYTVTIKVTDDGTGKLKTTVSYAKGGEAVQELSFTNSYKAGKSDEVVLEGTKTLTGRDMTDGEFTFVLKDAEGNVVETVTNKDGEFTFTGLTFDKAGTYVYTVSELKGEAGGVTYDETIYTVTIKVTDDGTGKLKTSVTYAKGDDAANAITFINSYKAGKSDEVVLEGTKTLTGRDMTDGEFTFVLKDAEGNVVETVTNKDGKFTFTGLTFDEVGTYEYTVSEVKGDVKNVIFDETVYTVIITVTDDGKGKLTASCTVDNIETENFSFDFVNKYSEEDGKLEKDVFSAEDPSVSIDGQKVNVGDKLVYTLSYTNASDETVTVTITDTLPAHTTFLSADADGVYADGKITWTLEIGPRQIETVSFQVSVDAENTVIENQATARVGENEYTSNVVVNHTVEDVTEKDVFNAVEPEISIDGGKVAAGQTLIYTIHYTNITGKDAQVTITDILPEHTTFLSADHNGVHADGVVTWILDVAAWESVEVSVQVTVDTPDVALDNQATVLEGENSYSTNEVTTDTYEVEDVDVTIHVEKTVINKSESTIGPDGFRFQLTEDGKQLQVVTSDQDGKASFKLTFTAADIGKTFTYQITEIDDGVKYVTYDKTVHTITVKVEQNEDHTLKVTVGDAVATQTNVAFTNTYEKSTIPDTGDHFDVVLMSFLLIASSMGLAGLMVLEKRRKNGR